MVLPKETLTLVLTILLSSIIFSALCMRYHSNQELEDILKNISSSASGRLRKNLYSIGNSSGRPKLGVQPSPLWVLELTAAEEGRLGVPNVKLIGNIHGTETAGREVLLRFILYLAEEYGKNDQVTRLLDNTRIHILPSLNPDGFSVANKYQCNGCHDCHGLGATDEEIIINRNFPDFFHADEMVLYTAETSAVMKWMEDIKFILSGSFYGFFMVALYPYFNKNETRLENPTPDDDVFQFLSKAYANNHAVMYKGDNCRKSRLRFDGGIKNGASWQNTDADMSDYNYIFKGCMEVRFQISCCMYPPENELEGIWNDNKNALLQYSIQANRGVTGIILDMHTEEPVDAKLRVVGRDMKFSNFNKTGEFWRILLPGQYQLEVEASGYYLQTVNFSIKDYETDFPQLTYLKIHMLNSSYSTTTEIAITTRKSTTSKPTIEMAKSNITTWSTMQQAVISEEIHNKWYKEAMVSSGSPLVLNLFLISLSLYVNVRVMFNLLSTSSF